MFDRFDRAVMRGFLYSIVGAVCGGFGDPAWCIYVCAALAFVLGFYTGWRDPESTKE